MGPDDGWIGPCLTIRWESPGIEQPCGCIQGLISFILRTEEGHLRAGLA